MTHLINIWNTLTGEELTKCVKKIKAELRYTTVDIYEEDIRKYASMDMGGEKPIARFGINDVTFLGSLQSCSMMIIYKEGISHRWPSQSRGLLLLYPQSPWQSKRCNGRFSSFLLRQGHGW